MYSGLIRFLFSVLLTSLCLLSGCHDKQPKLKRLSADAVILAFGDSLTSGVGTTPEMSYPSVLQELTKHTVINAGVPGEETSASLTRLPGLLDQYSPALVIVLLGGNDYLHKRPHIVTKANLKNIILMIQKSGAQAILISVPDYNLMLNAPTLYAELSQELKVPVENAIIPTLLKEPKYKSDYVHLNTQGYFLLAVAIANFLKHQGAL